MTVRRRLSKKSNFSKQDWSGGTALALLRQIRETQEEHPGAPPSAALFQTEHGEVWVAYDERHARELEEEESRRDPNRPVIRYEDLLKLEKKSKPPIGGALRVLKAFPGARIVD